MSDFLDVIHAMFEEDMAPQEEDNRRARDHLRRSIYVDMYGEKDYVWTLPERAETTGNAGDSAYTQGYVDPPVDADPSNIKLTHKPFVPATPMDVDSPLPIAGLKEAPLG